MPYRPSIALNGEAICSVEPWAGRVAHKWEWFPKNKGEQAGGHMANFDSIQDCMTLSSPHPTPILRQRKPASPC